MWIADKIYYQDSSGYTRAYQGSELVWERPSGERYITFTAKADNSNVVLRQKSSVHTVEYSLDGITWDEMKDGFISGTIINLNSGDTVYVRGILGTVLSSGNYSQFAVGGNVKVSGNINYLLNYSNPTSTVKSFCCINLFNDATGLTDASELILPATDLRYASSCYRGMFSGCSALTAAPKLPATRLYDKCYMAMFARCTSLTTAPELPATTLAYQCYWRMFANCTSLTTAPDLLATSDSNTTSFYEEMFSGCTNLNYIKCLLNVSTTSLLTTDWVYGVAASGTFVKNANMSNWTTGNSGIPQGWTVQNN